MGAMALPMTPPTSPLEEAVLQYADSAREERVAWLAFAWIRKEAPAFLPHWDRWVATRSRLNDCAARLWDIRIALLLRS